jgi:hypothetical protein
MDSSAMVISKIKFPDVTKGSCIKNQHIKLLVLTLSSINRKERNNSRVFSKSFVAASLAILTSYPSRTNCLTSSEHWLNSSALALKDAKRPGVEDWIILIRLSSPFIVTTKHLSQLAVYSELKGVDFYHYILI